MPVLPFAAASLYVLVCNKTFIVSQMFGNFPQYLLDPSVRPLHCTAVCSSVLFWQRNLEIASCCYILPYTASDHNWCMMMQINCCLRLATLLKQNLFHLCIESQTEREGITIRSQVLGPYAYLFIGEVTANIYLISGILFLDSAIWFWLSYLSLLPNTPMSRAVGEGDGGYSLQISDRK